MLFSVRIYIARGPWHVRDFCNISLPNIREERKSPTIWARGPGTEPYDKYGAGYCNTFIKILDEARVATFRTKTLDFTLVIPLNWLEKIEFGGCTGPPGRQYYLLSSILLYACTVARKDAKRNWKWRNKAFLWNFVIGGISIERLGPPGYAYDFEIRSRP